MILSLRLYALGFHTSPRNKLNYTTAPPTVKVKTAFGGKKNPQLWISWGGWHHFVAKFSHKRIMDCTKPQPTVKGGGVSG